MPEIHPRALLSLLLLAIAYCTGLAGGQAFEKNKQQAELLDVYRQGLKDGQEFRQPKTQPSPKAPTLLAL